MEIEYELKRAGCSLREWSLGLHSSTTAQRQGWKGEDHSIPIIVEPILAGRQMDGVRRGGRREADSIYTVTKRVWREWSSDRREPRTLETKPNQNITRNNILTIRGSHKWINFYARNIFLKEKSRKNEDQTGKSHVETVHLALSFPVKECTDFKEMMCNSIPSNVDRKETLTIYSDNKKSRQGVSGNSLLSKNAINSCYSFFLRDFVFLAAIKSSFCWKDWIFYLRC